VDATTLAAGAIFSAFLILSVPAWLWGPPMWRAARRMRIRRQPFPLQWREVLRRRMPAFARLPADVQLRLKKQAQVLLAEKPFIGCAGLEVTEEMRVLVAVQASLLLLRKHAGNFDGLRQILIYPGAFVVERPITDATGVVRDERKALAGESWQQGQVLLAWDEVLAGAADPNDGRNVVIHEFAHQLDQAHGAANGAPFLPGARRRLRWAEVLGQEYGALQESLAAGVPGLIDPYAATNPAEFFAVVSELFFEKPSELAAQHATLYGEYKSFYGVDPLAWLDTTAVSRR
jgi:Mlc titration factor MtfA (ptsG expression regulator)